MKKNLKQILAIVIAISMLVPCVFAAPVAVTATDSVTETVMEENLSEVEEETAFSVELSNDSECKYVKDVISLDASELYGVVAYKNDVETYTIALYNDRPGDDYVDRFLELFMNLPVYSENEPEEDREVLEITVSNNTDYKREHIYSYTDGIMVNGESTGYFIKSADIMAVFESMGESWGDDLYWPAEPEINDVCIYMQKIDGMGFLPNIDGILYGFEEKDGITAGIGRIDSPPSEITEMMSPFVSENEKVFYFIIAAYDTETESIINYTEKAAMEAEVFMPAGSEFSGTIGKDYRVYNLFDNAKELSVTESSLYRFSFELDTFGLFAVVYNPNVIRLNFYDGENIYHTIENLATTDTITLPENPQNKTVDGIECEFGGWYSREDGQGKRLYDGVTLSEIGTTSVFAYWQKKGEAYIESLELLDDPEEDENIAGTLYGYTETDEKTVKLLRFSENSESGQYLFERHAFRIKEGHKAIFFALAECDKVSGEILGTADGMTLGATISLASGDLLGKDYKVYKFTDSSSKAVTVTDSDPLSFTFLTEGLGTFLVVYDPRLFAVNFYDEGILYHTANISLEDTISIPEVPTREGYTFEGWYTDAGGNGTKLEDGMTYMDLLSENVYAYWKVKEPDIYEISDVDDFNSYASLIVSDNATYGKAIYILKNDIDVTSASLTPFGTQEAPFSGTFDGNGKTIKNVTFDDLKHVGIIGYMDGGTVKNLAVTYEDTTAKTYTNCVRFGGIVGVIDTATKSDVVVENCKTSGNVKISTAGFMRYGGIFSELRADAGNVKITDCVTFCNADIEAGKTAYIGGFGGYAHSTTNTRVYDYTIENCISHGNVSLISSATSAYAAGFIGHSFRDDPDVIGGIDGGGIFSTASLFADESNYTNCVSFGNSSVVSSKTAFYGPFAGSKNQFVNFNNCYVSSSQTSTGTSLCQVDVTSKSPEEMNKAEFLSDTLMFDTENVWCINGRGKADLAMFADMSLVIELGDKNADINTRYIEINGIQTEIETDIFTIPEGEENLLIEYTEKDETGDVVKTEYYFVDRADYKVKKLPMDSYMNSSEKTSIRTKGYTGIRFKARIETGVKFEETEYVIDEYGFVVSRKDILGENELTLDTEVKVTGVGYNKAQNIDVVFEQNDEYHTFTGVVKNIPVKHYATDLVCKTYTKISVDGEQFVVYGEPVVGNVYDTAKKLLETDPDNADLIKIVLDYEGAIGLPGDDLYSDEEPEIIQEPYNYRIISNYDIGQDDDGKWRFYYEVYDPFTGAKISDIPSVKCSDKAKDLGTALETGIVVKIADGNMIDDSEEMVLGKISEDNLTWLRVDSDGSVVACPVKSEVTCPVCVHDEVGNFTDEYRDIFGNNTANPLNITDKTMVSIVKYSDLSSMFKWGTISLSSVDDIKNGKKTLKCYNDKALDANNNFVTKYAEYIKAYICNDDKGNAAFVLVVVHGDEASLGETCDKDRDLQ